MGCLVSSPIEYKPLNAPLWGEVDLLAQAYKKKSLALPTDFELALTSWGHDFRSDLQLFCNLLSLEPVTQMLNEILKAYDEVKINKQTCRHFLEICAQFAGQLAAAR